MKKIVGRAFRRAANSHGKWKPVTHPDVEMFVFDDQIELRFIASGGSGETRYAIALKPGDFRSMFNAMGKVDPVLMRTLIARSHDVTRSCSPIQPLDIVSSERAKKLWRIWDTEDRTERRSNLKKEA